MAIEEIVKHDPVIIYFINNSLKLFLIFFETFNGHSLAMSSSVSWFHNLNKNTSAVAIPNWKHDIICIIFVSFFAKNKKKVIPVFTLWILIVLLAAVSEVEISQNCWLVLLTRSQAYLRGPLFQELKKSWRSLILPRLPAFGILTTSGRCSWSPTGCQLQTEAKMLAVIGSSVVKLDT